MSTATPPKPVGLNPSAKPLKKPGYRTAIIAGIMTTAVALASVIALALNRADPEPPINADTVTLAKFVTTPAYQKLPFDRQQLFMKVLEDRDDNDELEDAFDAGRITEDQFRAAALEAWCGQQLKRSEKFQSYSNEAARLRYVREILDKKDEKDKRQAEKAKSSGPKDPKPSDSVKRDNSMEDIRIAAWPADVRSKWQAFRTVYEAEKDKREAAAAPAQG